MKSKSTKQRSRSRKPAGRKRTGKTDWSRIDATTDEDIARQIADDPDVAPEFTEDMLKDAIIVRPKRTPVLLRVEPDVLLFFRRGGPGYQTRMNRALRAFMEARLKQGGSTKK